MATISNIENITSVSSENVSMVVLEFAQTVNMDAVTIEMRESLDQITGYFPEEVSNPIIMKMNPDMLPVMVAAAEAGDMEGSELTDYVNNTVLPELESIEGVASVTASGLIDEEVRVIIRQDKIDAVNRKVKDALDGKFAEAESEMEDAKAELEDGKTKLEEGERALAEQTANAESQISSGQNQLISGEAELNQKIAEVESGLAELETAEKEIQAQEAQLAEAEEQLDALPGQLTEAEEGLAAIESGITGLEAAAAGLEQAKPAFEGKELEKQLDEAEKNPDTPPAALAALRQQLTALQQQLDAVLQPLAAMGIDTSGSYEEIQQKINTQKSELISQKTQMETAVGLLREMAEEIPNQRQAIAEGKKQIRDGKKQIKAGKSQLTEAKQQLTDAKSQIESGKISLSAALSELNRNKISATIEIASGKAQITAGESQLDTARKELDSQKDAAYEKSDVEGILTADMIKGILAAQNFTMPAGYVAEEGIDFLVRVGDKLTDTQSLEDLMLVDLHMKGLKPIYLSDVADVTVTDNSSEVYAKINGHAGVLFSMQKQSGYSTGDVSKRIQKKFTEIEEESGNTHFVKLMDQGIYIDMVVNSVLENMISGAVLAVLILLLFLKSVRPTVVIAFSIPISILAAIVLMYFSGININIISLSGLALGIGMLVDNSIVVIENIYRLRNEGVSAKKAAVEGARQVAGAIAASTLTTICVFLPIVFTEGITRQLFVDMGLTIAYSLLASLAVALTVVPMMGSGLLKNTDEKKSRIFGGLQSGYGKMIGFALNHRAIVLIGAVLALVLSAVLSVSKGTEFMPEMESTQMSLTLSLPDEGAGKQELAEMSDKVTERIQDIPDVEEIGAMSQGGGMMGVMGDSGSDTVSMYLILKEDKELDSLQLAEEIKERTADLACELNIQTSSMDMSALGGSGISVKVKGRELDTLKELAAQAAAVLETVEGAVDVSDGIEEKTLEMRIVVDKDKAMKYQLTTAQVFQFLQGKLADAKSATTLTTDVKDYPVMVISENDTKLTREQIKKLKIEGKDKNGNPKDVPLKNIVEFQETEGFSSINREAQTRYVTVSAKVDAGYNIGLVAGEAEQKLKEIELPKGYTLEMSGENETINESMVELLKMLGLAVLLIYLIMVAQFQSLLSPFIIMFTIPLAFTGGFLGLWATGKPVSVIAMIGFVMLSGIIVNNGIVLVDYINQLRRGGMEKRAAIIESGRTRLRPILMTALTTILGLSTMAVGLGMGADMVQPMAIVAVGGLLYGTLLTLVVVPCIYDLLNRKKDMTEEEI